MVTVTSRNTISQVGCLVTTLANVLSFLGYKVTPAGVDAVADTGDGEKSYYKLNSADLAQRNEVVSKLTGNRGSYKLKESVDVSEVEKLLLGGVPVVARFGNGSRHFVAMAGYRKNANGEIVGFLMRDPGSRNPAHYFLDKKNLWYPKNPAMEWTGYAYIKF